MRPLARTSLVPLERCNLAKTLDLIGDRWSLLILRGALFGLRRFDDFQSDLNIPRSVLSERLKKLTKSGLFTRETYRAGDQRARAEYQLTEIGQALQPALIMLTQWGDSVFEPGQPAPLSFVDPKGNPARAAFVNEAGDAVSPAQLRPVLRL